jgi:hypothetical protein
MFNEAFYNETNTSLVLNQVYLNTILTTNCVSPMILQNKDIIPVNFDTSGYNTFGYRLVEIAAYSLFASATARAAIANEYECICGSNNQSILDSLSTIFTSETNNIYNFYSTLPQFTSPTSQIQNFNFSGVNFAINYFHTGQTMGINRGSYYYGLIRGEVNSFNHQLLLLFTENI